MTDRVIRCKLFLNQQNSPTEDFDIAHLSRLEDLEDLVHLLLLVVRVDLSVPEFQVVRVVRDFLESLISQ